MKERAKLEKYVSYLDKAETVALLCHVSPDSDTLGSALALRLALQKLGKQVCVFCDDEPPIRLSFLPTIKCINQDFNIKKFDVASAIDCSDGDRFNVIGKYFKHAVKRIVLDHHKTTDNFADFIISVPEAAATAELVYYVIELLEEKHEVKLFDYDVAVLLYAAIVGDTGAFSFSNTTEETFRIASALLEYDVPSRDIIYKMIKSQSLKRFTLKSRVLNKAKFYSDNKIGIITFTKADFDETNTSPDNTEGIINEIVDIDEVLIAFAVSEVYDKNYKVSIRTKAPIDAAELSTIFGGGGHERASGCRVSGFYEDVIEKLLKAANDLL